MRKLRVLDLFSGIGGFSLGLERTGGFETVAFCEIEPYCRAVLAKHWPDVPCYPDIRELTADALRRDGIAVDVICGGFPCQDISYAGKRSGLQGSRSGLWKEYARIIGELRPRFAIMENVSGLLSLGMGDVLGDLAALGYDATWDCIPASAVGAPHTRDRVWIIAHADSQSVRKQSECELGGGNTSVSVSDRAVYNADGQGQHDGSEHAEVEGSSQSLVNTNGQRLEKPRNVSRATADAESGQSVFNGNEFGRQWEFEPAVGRVAHGVPARMDRIKALGNAVVPQIPELLGRAILKAEGLAA